MAYTFTAADLDAFYLDGSFDSTYFTFCAWIICSELANANVIMGAADKDVDRQRTCIYAAGDEAGDPLAMAVDGAAGQFNYCLTTGSYNTGGWVHCAGWGNLASNDLKVFRDYSDTGTSVLNKTDISGLDRIGIGYFADVSPSAYFEGQIAECAMWSVKLTDDEVKSLAKGYSPLFIRPASLVFYAPLVRDYVDRISGTQMTVTGSPAVYAGHPPMIYPPQPMTITPISAAVSKSVLGAIVCQGALSRKLMAKRTIAGAI